MATCAKKVIVVMEHVDKQGNSRIVEKCTFPLTSPKCVDVIVTDMGVFDVVEKGLKIRELAEKIRIEDVIKKTGVNLIGC